MYFSTVKWLFQIGLIYKQLPLGILKNNSPEKRQVSQKKSDSVQNVSQATL